jgi:hypothetical protein
MCFCEIYGRAKCCDVCEDREECTQVCNACNPHYSEPCINPNFRREERERYEEMYGENRGVSTGYGVLSTDSYME